MFLFLHLLVLEYIKLCDGLFTECLNEYMNCDNFAFFVVTEQKYNNSDDLVLEEILSQKTITCYH